MNGAKRLVRSLTLAGACALTAFWAIPGLASNASDVQAMVNKLVLDINRGDAASVELRR